MEGLAVVGADVGDHGVISSRGRGQVVVSTTDVVFGNLGRTAKYDFSFGANSGRAVRRTWTPSRTC